MAAPNIVGVTTIIGKTIVANVSTVATDILTNANASNKVFKINSVYVANISGNLVADVTTSVVRSSIEYKLASTVSVPSDSTLVVVSKDSSLYLEEGDSIRISASANNNLQAICSYEEIS